MRRGLALLLLAGSLSTHVVGASPALASPGTGFAPYQVIDQRSDFMAVAIGDVTGDHRPDLVATAYTDPLGGTGRELRVYRQTSDGTLDPDPGRIPVPSSSSDNAMKVSLADLDDDRDLDVLVTTYDGVALFRQDTGGLTYGRTIGVDEAAWNVDAIDLAADGLTDLVVNTAKGVRVLRQAADGSFSTAVLSTTPSFTTAVGDVTGDGLSDVLATTRTGFDVYAQQAGGFAAAASYPSGAPDPTSPVRAIAVGDIDTDGRAEVHVSAGTTADQARVVTWRQTSTGGLVVAATRSTLANPGAILVADVAGTSLPDLVVAHGEGSDVRASSLGVYESTPGVAPTETAYATQANNGFGSDPGQVAVGDLDGDGSLDLAGFGGFWGTGLAVMLGAKAGETHPAQDVTPPETTITGGPSGPSYSRSATFSFAADEPGSTFACSIDNAFATPCTSPTTYDALSQGTHSFSVTATDQASNRDPSPATSTFTVTPSADVSVSLSASPTTVKKGTGLTWSSIVYNSGPDAAQSVTFTQDVPAGLSGVVATRSDGTSCSVTTTTVSCLRPTLAPGDRWTIEVSGTVAGNKGTLASSSQVATSTHDADSGNDSSPVVTVKVGNGKGN